MAARRPKKHDDEWQQFVENVRKSDLTRIATSLGIEVQRTGEGKGKALCPFHDDHHPSLHFFVSNQDGAHLFKCHVCGNGGDAFEFVKLLRGCDFITAAKEIGDLLSIPLPGRGRRRFPTSSATGDGLLAALEIYSKQTEKEKQRLEQWARDRGFEQRTLDQFDVVCAEGSKLVQRTVSDRILRERLSCRWDNYTSASNEFRQQTSCHVHGGDFRDPFRKERIIFPIRDATGKVMAFAGRSLSEDDQPKYLFTRGFRKRDALYGIDQIFKALNQTVESQSTPDREQLHLFLVEGLTNVLRLGSLEMPAVGILGADMSEGQFKQIDKLASTLADRDRQLCLHLFLDTDSPGRAATLRLIPRLAAHAIDHLYQLNIINPPSDVARTYDPDELLRDTMVSEAKSRLAGWAVSIARYLIAKELSCANAAVPEHWSRASRSRRLLAIRRVRDRLDPSIGLGDITLLFETSIGAASDGEHEWAKRLLLALAPSHEDIAKPPVEAREVPAAILFRAMEMARASTQRREVPIDDGSWERIFRAYDISAEFLKERLSLWGTGGDGSRIEGNHWQQGSTGFLEPLLAVRIPKKDGDTRLKAMPCAEDLALQQYLLNELLCERPEIPGSVADCIPAVRYSSQKGTWTTGVHSIGAPAGSHGEDQSGPSPIWSFAYQVDMDVVNGHTRDVADGLFRHYFDCWNDFTIAVDRRLAQLGDEIGQVHVGRLDIRKFYDRLPRSAVHRVLFPAVQKCLETFINCGLTMFELAPALREPEQDKVTPEIRAKTIVDTLCELSFHYPYHCPSTGRPSYSDRVDRGIPQGPDLSAYLATIALFPLDSELGLLAHSDRAFVSYSRYVDDIVIISRTHEGLQQLRRRIEFELRQIGLELNPKAEPLPAMTPSEVRAWLRDERGGLIVSGLPEAVILHDPFPSLADDHGVDRREALRRLADPDLYRPSNTGRLEVVRSVFLCPHLRYNDESRAIALLWQETVCKLCTPGSAEPSTASPCDLVDVFLGYVHSCASVLDFTPTRWLQLALAGLDKYLRSRRFLVSSWDNKERRTGAALANGACKEHRRGFFLQTRRKAIP